MLAVVSVSQQLFTFTGVPLTLHDAFTPCNGIALVDNLFAKLGIGRKGGVVFLNSSVRKNKPGLSRQFFTVKLYAVSEYFSYPFFSHTVTEMDKIARIKRKLMFERSEEHTSELQSRE